MVEVSAGKFLKAELLRMMIMSAFQLLGSEIVMVVVPGVLRQIAMRTLSMLCQPAGASSAPNSERGMWTLTVDLPDVLNQPPYQPCPLWRYMVPRDTDLGLAILILNDMPAILARLSLTGASQ